MPTTITFRRGTAAPTSALTPGLTLGEPAFDTTNRNLYVGLGTGVTAAWVGARISSSSADIAAGLTNWIVNAKAVNDYVSSLGGISSGTAVTWTQLQTFNAGISATGALTFNGTITGATATFSRLVTGNAGFSGALTGAVTGNASTATALQTARGFSLSGDVTASVVNFDGTGSVTLNTAIAAGAIVDADINATANIAVTKLAANKISGVTLGNNLNTLTIGSGLGGSSYNGSAAVTITNNGVTSFNGRTGAVDGASLGANTFSGLQTSASGFSGPLTGAVTGSLTGTATNASSLGETAAASWALLASPTFTGTPAAPTPAVGTNTTQIATTAFVQSEIVADAVTSFNGRTGSVQGVSAAVAGDGISVSGATGSVTFTNTGVTRAVAGTGIGLNANTGTVTITNNGVQSFNGLTGAVGGVSAAQANTFTALQTFTGGISAAGGITFSTMYVAGTSRFVGTASFTPGGISADDIRADNLYVKYIAAGLVGSGLTLEIRSPVITPDINAIPPGGASIRLQTDDGNAFPTTNYYYTIFAPSNVSANQTFTLPTESGTFALRGANTFTGLQTLTAGLSAAGGITFNGTITGATATFSRLVTGNAGFSGALTGTATNASSLGGTAAASWAQLAAPNTFTGINTFNAGVTLASTLDVTGLAKFNGNVTVGDAASDVLTVTSGATFGITDHSGAARFASTLTANGGITASAIDVTGLAKFNGNVTVGDNAADVLTVTSGATFGITDHSGVARFAAGVTFSSTTDHAGVARFAAGITANTIDVSGTSRFTGNVNMGATLTVEGNLIVNGTTTTINSTTISVDDKNIVLGDITSPTDAGADGGGFTLKGTTDKNFYWKQSNGGSGNTLDVGGAWNSDQHLNLASLSGKFYIHQAEVLSKTALGSTVVGSSLTSVGTVTSGTWNSDIVYVDGGSY